ncbi:MAG: LysR family transcriptional regulator [Sulfitobacter sp.]
MRIDPRHLVQLSMIIEAGSFQTAAERLGMTQPALSRNIRVLEGRIGSSVFDRRARKAVPTEIGLRLAEHGLTVRIAEEQAAAYSTQAASGSAGELRVGAPPIIAGHFLTHRLSKFVRDNPDCHIEVRVGLVHELRSMLERSQIDIILGPRNLSDGVADLSFELLVDERIGIICRSDHPLTRFGKVGPQDLALQKWVAHSRGSTLRLQTEAALVAMGLNRIHVTVETDSIRSVLEIVEFTDLITTMPRETTQTYLRENLTFLDVDHPQFSRPVGIIKRVNAPPNAVISKFVKLLKQGVDCD